MSKFADSDDEPISRRSVRASRKSVTYTDSPEDKESEDEIVVPKRAAKSKRTPPDSQKKMEEQEDDEEGGSTVRPKLSRERNGKEQLVADLLCRWWYVMPEWPPADFDFGRELEKRGLREVNLDDWEEASDTDKEGRLKCYALTQFPGVFRDAKGNLIDCRPNEGKPSFNNLMKKNEKELRSLLNSAITNQLTQLDDPELEKELKAMLKKK